MIRILKYGEVANEDIFARFVPEVNVEDVVAQIIQDVRQNGDKALLRYTEKFDGAKLDCLQVSQAELDEAMSLVDACLSELGLSKADIESVAATGYGKKVYYRYETVNHTRTPIGLFVHGVKPNFASYDTYQDEFIIKNIETNQIIEKTIKNQTV